MRNSDIIIDSSKTGSALSIGLLLSTTASLLLCTRWRFCRYLWHRFTAAANLLLLVGWRGFWRHLCDLRDGSFIHFLFCLPSFRFLRERIPFLLPFFTGRQKCCTI